jgi:hypothetical protein
MLEFDVGQMSFENRKKTCEAHVVFTIKSGMTGCMDCDREGTILENNFHEERCNRLLI